MATEHCSDELSFSHNQPPLSQFDAQNLSFSEADFWVDQEGLLDSTECVLSALQESQEPHQDVPMGSLEVGGESSCLHGYRSPLMNNAAPEYVTEDMHSGVQATSPSSENLDRVGCKIPFQYPSNVELTASIDHPNPLWCVRRSPCGSQIVRIDSGAGFGYWLSICSDPAVASIRQLVGSDEFDEIAQDLKISWVKQSSLELTESTSKGVEPEPELAWKYCNSMC